MWDSRDIFLISASTNEGACYACPLGTYCNPDPTPCPFDKFCPVDKTYAPTFVGAFEKASCYVEQALKKLKTFQLKHGMVIVEEEIAASQDCRFFCIQEIFLKILMPKIYFFNPSNFGEMKKDENCSGFSSFVRQTNKKTCVFLKFPSTSTDTEKLWTNYNL